MSRFYPGTLENQRSIITKLDAIAADVSDLKGVAITVTAQTRDSVTVTGQIVYLHEGDDTSGPVIQQFAYNGQPVTFSVRKGFHYCISMSSTLPRHHSPNTVSGIANIATSVVITYEDVRTITSFAAVKAFLDQLTGTLEERVSAGRVALVDTNSPIEIADTWTTDEGAAIDDPMIIVDVKAYEGEDQQLHVGAKLQREYATVASIQFDAPNQQEATEENMVAGLFYRGYGEVFDATKTYAVNKFVSYEGQLYKCTTAITTAGAWDPAKWQLQSSFQTGALVALTTVEGQALPYSSYQKIYKNQYNDSNIVGYGHNRYETSAWRQYLNSDAAIGGWWSRKHVGQMPPDGLNTRGYLAGCSQALLAAARKVRITCSANTSIDGGGVYPLVDLFWLSSGTEFNGSVNTDEGTVDKYWIDRMGGLVQSNPAHTGRVIRKVTAKTSSGVYVWTRSASRSYTNYVWYVGSSGQVNNHYASNQYAGCPACVIY